MKQSLKVIAKGAVYFIGMAVLVVCFVLLPEIAREETVADPTSGHLVYPFLIGAWIISIPVFVALYQLLKLLRSIEKGKAFTQDSVKTIQNIKKCAIVFCSLTIAGLVAVITTARIIDPREEVTFLFTFGAIIIFVSLIVTTVVAILQKFLQDAIEIKSENDLIV